MRIDHVILATRDLEASAKRCRLELGFESISGGTHESLGTANRIIPFGAMYPQYLELLAPSDPSLPAGRAVHERSATGDCPFGWAVSVPDLSGAASRLGIEPIPMSRQMPDGRRVSWQIVGIQQAAASNGFLPFFISADHDPLQARSRGGVAVQHQVVPISISRVEVAGPGPQLRDWLGGADIPVHVAAGEPRVVSFCITTSAGEVAVRQARGPTSRSS